MEYRNIFNFLEQEKIIKSKMSIMIHKSNNGDEVNFTFINELNTEINYGRVMYDDIKVNYCIISENMLIKKIYEAYYNGDYEYLRKFVFSNFSGQKAFEIGKLAKKLFSLSINTKLNNKDILEIIEIKDKMDDLKENINKSSFYAIYYVLLEKIRNKYLYINGLMNYNIDNFEQLIKDKWYALEYVDKTITLLPDETFSEWYLKCLKVTDKSDMLNNIDHLFYHSFSNLIPSFTKYEVTLNK